MSSALITGLRDPKGRSITTLPWAVRNALMAADEALRAHGMQFEILCETCRAMDPESPNGWTVLASHGNGDGSVSELTCRCTRRRFVALA